MKGLIAKHILRISIISVYSFIFLIPITSAQGNKVFSESRIEVKTGAGLLLNKVSLLSINKGVEFYIPGGETGFSAIIDFRQPVFSHFFVGYQFDYFAVDAELINIDPESGFEDTGTLSYIFGHSLTIGYNFRKTGNEDNKFDYQLYYKGGLVTLKIPETDITNHDPERTFSVSETGVGIIAGLGIGVTYDINPQLALTGVVEYNHIASSISDIFRPYRMFTKSPYYISRYSIASVGVSYKLFGQNSRKGRKSTQDHLPWAR
ncbi:MAG: hypothetical protein ABFS16_07405 [Bacteroidota bacterium]